MKKQRFWALPWLCLCLNFDITSCKTVEIATPGPVYKVQFALSPIVDETVLGPVFDTGHLSDINITQLLNDGRTISLLIHGDNSLRQFKQEIVKANLPIIAFKITTVD